MICIIDYGVGNVQAFLNLFSRNGVDVMRARTQDDLLNATSLVLPGVGHFDHAMEQLNCSGLRSKLEDLVLVSRVPIIGICVGMQILASGSDEGKLPGLNWIPGRVRAFQSHPLSCKMQVPHMGWNDISIVNNSKLVANGLEHGSQFYFLHSYYFDSVDKSNVVATTNYGLEFESIISHRNIHGVQFHPEKSHHWGQLLLTNFLK